jgi:hypothetical protein
LGISCEERENHQAPLVNNVRESDLALLVKNEREADLALLVKNESKSDVSSNVHFNSGTSKGLLCQCFHANRIMKNVFPTPFGVSPLHAPFEELVHGSCIITAQIFPLF